MDNAGWGTGCEEPGSRGDGTPGSVENTRSDVFVTTVHDQRRHHCQLVSFPNVSKCQARLLVINNRIYLSAARDISISGYRYRAL